ncbi:MAG: nicotinamide riboside transporter PnuC [Chitinophagaceae bacterium]|nr:MAG: nicotinamide riboside transporter PnuC [Chitinophagaceae bacterium]
MDITHFAQQFWEGILQTSLLEFIAVLAGIVSVWFSRKENIWVYPVGLINTGIYMYLSIKGDLFGEASVNLYYTIMSIYGWVLWARRDARSHEAAVRITFSSRREWLFQLLFFAAFYLAIFFALDYVRSAFQANTIPAADAFASATAFTGMWLMARKKVESWYWWIATNIASIPLYYVKGYVFTSVLFFILLLMAFWGLGEWKQRARGATSK